MTIDADRLMNMLPAVYRARDASRGELRALMGIVAEQIAVLEEDLAQLYDDQFAETCAAWVIPYIGDLLANTPLYDGGADADEQPRALFPDLTGPRFVPRVALRARADVAKTIFYRRRKATLPMLEALAADVTGWTARVVEFFELLRWNQCVRNHLRMFSHGQPDLRRDELLERINGPFDAVSHNVDVRPIGQLDGWYETRNIGFFLWRLRSYELDDADARVGVGGAYRFRFNRLGLDAPLFTRAKRNDLVGVTELQVPGPIRHAFFRDDLRRHKPPAPASDLYGLPLDLSPEAKRSFSILADGAFIKPENICAADLSTWRRPTGPTAHKVAVDVHTGRIAFGTNFNPEPAAVSVSFHYGFAADLGGGSYPRAAWLIKRELADLVIRVKKGTAVDTIAKALAQWATDKTRNTIIVIEDNRTYDEGQLVLDPPQGKWLAIEADDRRWPHLRLSKPMKIACADEAAVTLSGLLIEGALSITNLEGRLRLLHSTIQPNAGISTAAAAKGKTFRLEVAFSILGAIQLRPDAGGIAIFDSIVDAGAGAAITGTKANETAPPLRIERSTVFGSVNARELEASESIFTGVVFVERRQQGCVRFSFLPRGSRTPRPYRCQPDLEIRTRDDRESERLHRDLTAAELKAIADAVYAFLAPSFTSTRYGDPGYAQLHLAALKQISQGAEDGSEMGALCHLKQPQRESNLRSRLGEYLPFGLQPGIIYVT